MGRRREELRGGEKGKREIRGCEKKKRKKKKKSYLKLIDLNGSL